MERGLMMVLHSIIIGIVAFLVMRYILGQSISKAEDRSIVFASAVLLYMVLFGHGLPTRLNRNLSI